MFYVSPTEKSYIILSSFARLFPSEGHTYERGHIEAWFRTCRQSGKSVISPLTNSVLENTTLVTNYSMRFAVEHYIATRQAEIDARIQAEALQQQESIDAQGQLLETLRQPDNIPSDTMAGTVGDLAAKSEKEKISWFPVLICLGLLFSLSTSLSLLLPSNNTPVSTLHPSVTLMRNGWISTEQREKKEKETLKLHAKRVKLENERKLLIDRLNHNYRYWEQRGREEREEEEKRKKKMEEELMHLQRKTLREERFSNFCGDFFQLVTNALTIVVHLGIRLYVFLKNALHTAWNLIPRPPVVFALAIIFGYPFIYFYNKKQKANKAVLFLANSAARKEKRANKRTEDNLNEPDSPRVSTPPKRRNKR